ncbi:hypothetical protein EBR43_03300 [bacterium]|nr:hypothetical protein [bacterium]
MKLVDLIDKKILFLHFPVSKHAVIEGTIKELSPSKNFVKINNDWYLIENIRVLELFQEENKKLGFS